jgi:hypothetical protein
MILLWALSLALSPSAHAAACCGAGSAAPTVITGDDRAQLSASLSQSRIIGDAPASGLPVFRADGDNEQIQTLRLEGALLLSDRWQAGASLPFSRRARSTPSSASSASGLGDIGLSAAYELLPEWEYSAWRPRGFVFVQALIPTGGSIYEASFDATEPWGLTARGRGFYALGAGTVFLKTWGNWDASAVAEAHRSFARTFAAQTDAELRLVPGWGGSAALAAGYSPARLPLRLGLAISPAYEGSVEALGLVDSTSDPQLVWNASAQLSWMAGHASALSAIYTDQTLMGPATNVSLSRSLALLYQQRWER